MSTFLQPLFLLICLAFASTWDVRQKRIPNWLTLGGGVLAMAYFLILHFMGEPIGANMLGMVVGTGIMFLLYLGGGVGGGDVKLMIAVGLLAGYPDVIHYLFYGGLCALILILGRLAWRGETLTTLGGIVKSKPRLIYPSPDQREKNGENVKGRSVSFSLALLLAVLWVWILNVI